MFILFKICIPYSNDTRLKVALGDASGSVYECKAGSYRPHICLKSAGPKDWEPQRLGML